MQFHRFRLFQGLKPTTLDQFARALTQRRAEAGEILFLEGEPCSEVFFVVEGQVRIFRAAQDGREQVLARLGPGSVFNSVPPLLDGAKNQASARALTALTVYRLSGSDYLRLLQDCPDFAIAVLRDFAGRLAHLTGLVEDLSLHSVRGRLARFLLLQAAANESVRHWTQDELAEQLGTVRDVVGRTLRSFAEAGYIRKDRQRILILDREALEREANS